VLELLPFMPLRTFVVATERLKPKARDLFRAAVTAKLGWYGAEVIGVREVARTGEAVASAYGEATAFGATGWGLDGRQPLDARRVSGGYLRCPKWGLVVRPGCRTLCPPIVIN